MRTRGGKQWCRAGLALAALATTLAAHAAGPPAATDAPAPARPPPAADAPAKPNTAEEVYYSIDPEKQTVEATVVNPANFDPKKLQTGEEIFIRGKEGYKTKTGQMLWVSTTRVQWPGEGTLANMVDADPETRWSSDYKDNQEITFDLGVPTEVLAVKVTWERAAAKHWVVQGTADGETWRTIKEFNDGKEGPRVDEVPLTEKVRGVRLQLLERATQWGFSIFELELVTPASLKAAAAKAAAEAAAAAKAAAAGAGATPTPVPPK